MLSVDQIRNHVTKLRPPAEVKSIDVSAGRDSDGDPAFWIYLNVDGSAPDTAVSTLGQFARRLRTEILKRDSQAWPYVIVQSED